MLSRTSHFAGGRTCEIASTYLRTPHAGVISAREANRTQHSAASVADFARKDSMFRKEIISLVSCEPHGCTAWTGSFELIAII